MCFDLIWQCFHYLISEQGFDNLIMPNFGPDRRMVLPLKSNHTTNLNNSLKPKKKFTRALHIARAFETHLKRVRYAALFMQPSTFESHSFTHVFLYSVEFLLLQLGLKAIMKLCWNCSNFAWIDTQKSEFSVKGGFVVLSILSLLSFRVDFPDYSSKNWSLVLLTMNTR